MTYARFHRDPASLLATFTSADAPTDERQAAGTALVELGRADDVGRWLRTSGASDDRIAQLSDDLVDAQGAAAPAANVQSSAARAADALGAAVRRGDGDAAWHVVRRLARIDPDRDRAARLVDETRAAMEAGRIPNGTTGRFWCSVLARFGERYRDALLGWHRSADEFDRHAAATNWFTPGRWTVPHAFESLDDAKEFVWMGAMFHFADAKPFAADVVDGLASRIHSADPSMARRAATAAGFLGDAGWPLVGVLRERATDTGIGVSLTCRHALLRITNRVDDDTIRKIRLGLEARDFEATQAVVTLGGRAAPLLDVLAETMPSHIPAIRADFCEAIGRMGGAVPLRELVDVLLPALAGDYTSRDIEEDDPMSVRHGYSAPAPADLDQSDVAAAAQALAELGAVETLPRLRVIRDRITDTSNRKPRELRWTIAQAIEVLGG
ncbi:MAG: hypothetical protein K8T90_13150 [Planctomycetes bacterium]|nr:hypothetical protein [Planctomycetota bacterium]